MCAMKEQVTAGRTPFPFPSDSLLEGLCKPESCGPLKGTSSDDENAHGINKNLSTETVG